MIIITTNQYEAFTRSQLLIQKNIDIVCGIIKPHYINEGGQIIIHKLVEIT